jgi:hypothetical protein
MKIIRAIILAAGMVFSPHLLHSQTFTVSGLNNDAMPVQSAAPDSIVQVTAEAQGLQLVSPENLPPCGTFWEVMPYGVMAPLPCPPFDPTLPVYAITDNIFLVDSTGGQLAVSPRQSAAAMSATAAVNDAAASLATAVVNLINQVQTAEANRQARSMMRAMGMAVPSPGDGGDSGDGGDYSPMFSGGTPIDTNGLWLEITNVSNGWSHLNLHNGTNMVYAIWSTTNLLTGWQVQMELWPTNGTVIPTVTPFSVQNFDRQNLFLRAEDWTDVDTDGDGVPDWWGWMYFGTANIVATNLDYSGNGNTFAQDYSNNIPPRVFTFNGIILTNNYVNFGSVAAQLDAAGYPYYIATLVDDTNFDDAIWNTYTSTNVVLNLGVTEGWHEVWIGLRGFADKPSVAAWQWCRLKLDYTPPALVITGPTNGTVDTPMIQLTGYSSEDLKAISFDITNSAGLLTNQQISVTDRFFDTNTWEFTTNTLQGYDIFLTNGVNTITIHATDLAGNVTTLVTNFTLDYSGKTNRPVVQLTWPNNGTLVSGNNFTLDGQLADPTAIVSASITDTNGNTNVVAGLVGRTGQFWVQNIPLSAGTNALTLTVVDVVGNTTVTNINLVQSPVVLTLDPVADPQQLWQPTINLTGTISDATYAVWVNGVKGHNNGDGTWSANNVPVDSGGTAGFTVTGYSSDETQPDGSHGN